MQAYKKLKKIGRWAGFRYPYHIIPFWGKKQWVCIFYLIKNEGKCPHFGIKKNKFQRPKSNVKMQESKVFHSSLTRINMPTSEHLVVAITLIQFLKAGG